MPTKRVMRLLSVAVAAPVLLSSCDSSSIFDPSDDIAGTYQLTVVAGRSMPNATFQCDPGECADLPNGGTRVFTDGTLVLHDNGTFVETNHYIETPTGGPSENLTYSSTGNYDVFGDQITLSAPAQNRFIEGSITEANGDIRINYIERGDAYEYRR